MKIYSASLGMELDSNASSLTPAGEPGRLVLTIDSTAPLPMAFVCTLEPRDLRTLARMALRPRVMLRLFRMILAKTGRSAHSK